MIVTISETDATEQFGAALESRPIAAQLERHSHILDRGQSRNELKVLEYEPDEFIANTRTFVFIDFAERDTV